MTTREDLKKDFLEIIGSFKEYLSYLQGLDFEGPLREKSSDFSLAQQSTLADEDKATSLGAVRKQLGDCQRCPLGSSRKNLVFGTGNPNARLMFVGEAPGRDEDLQGKPFVGKAGQLLTRIINAIGLDRKDVYIANILKCRPPGNRDPLPEEIVACEPFLIKQLEVIKPKIVIALGTFAAQTLLKTTEAISRLRGRFHLYQGIKLMPTYHPAYLLRNPQKKRDVWEDMQLVQEECP